MSEQNATQPAADITDQAANWIQRRDFWDWSETDQASLDAWLAQSLAHRIAYHRLDAAWSRTERLAALRSPAASNEAHPGKLPSLLVRAVAALLVAGVVGIGGVAYYFRTPPTLYATGVGQHKTVMLADGSQVDLNTNTVLSARLSATGRTVTLLHGEAYFQIRHDSARAFAVIAGNHRVTDLGTKFLIRSDPNRLEVSLVEGRAEFDVPGASAQSPIVLAPGDRLVVSDNLIHAAKKTSQDLANQLGWRRGMLIFDNAPLGDVAAELNRYNSEKIVVANEHVADVRISASFRTNGIEDFAQLAQAMLGLRVQHLKGETVISR